MIWKQPKNSTMRKTFDIGRLRKSVRLYGIFIDLDFCYTYIFFALLINSSHLLLIATHSYNVRTLLAFVQSFCFFPPPIFYIESNGFKIKKFKIRYIVYDFLNILILFIFSDKQFCQF